MFDPATAMIHPQEECSRLIAQGIRSPARRHRITSRSIDHANIQQEEIPGALPFVLIRTQLHFAGSATEGDGKRAHRVARCSRWTDRLKMSAQPTRIAEVDSLKIVARRGRIAARLNDNKPRQVYPGTPMRSAHGLRPCSGEVENYPGPRG